MGAFKVTYLARRQKSIERAHRVAYMTEHKVLWCGVMEEAMHFFFHCIKYIGKRQVFNDTVRDFQPLIINLIHFWKQKL